MTDSNQTNQHHLEENITMKSAISFTCAGHDISGTLETTDDQWNFESQDQFFLQHFPFGIASWIQTGTQADSKGCVIDSIKALVASKQEDFQFS